MKTNKSCIPKDHTSSELSLKSPNTTSNISAPKADNTSDGANPIIHQCHMQRNRPLTIKESNIQLRNEVLFK